MSLEEKKTNICSVIIFELFRESFRNSKEDKDYCSGAENRKLLQKWSKNHSLDIYRAV